MLIIHITETIWYISTISPLSRWKPMPFPCTGIHRCHRQTKIHSWCPVPGHGPYHCQTGCRICRRPAWLGVNNIGKLYRLVQWRFATSLPAALMSKVPSAEKGLFPLEYADSYSIPSFNKGPLLPVPRALINFLCRLNRLTSATPKVYHDYVSGGEPIIPVF